MTRSAVDTPILEAAIEYQRGSFSLAIHFTLRAQWTVLFGASGAGKTTLLRVLAGLTLPSRGLIVLKENKLVDTRHKVATPPGERKIGFVMQQSPLFPHLTVRENIAFGLNRWRRTEREARVDELLRLFEMEAMAARKPKELSGGERQRIVLAQVLAPRPELLLLDEPFNALDVSTRATIVSKLISSGVPVLYVSHDLADAWQINADAILLESGKITAQGETRTVLGSQRRQILAQLGADGT
jgi:molybdate transport system ATP-binding protein